MEESKIVIYQTEDGQTQIDVHLENDTVWLTQAQMAELFQTDRTSIVRHVNNIYKVEELEKESTCAKIAQVQIIPSATATNALQPHYSFGSSTTTASSIAPMAANDCRTIPS